MHDALGCLFVDPTSSTGCMLDVWPFVCRTTVDDGAVGAALLMALKMIYMLSRGTIPTLDNTKIHHHLFACIHNVQ